MYDADQMYSEEEYAVAFEQVKAEFAAKVAGRSRLTIKDTFEIRQYAKSRTDLDGNDLTAEEAAWKTLYLSLSEQLRETAPDLMAEVEPDEQRVDGLQSLQNAIGDKLVAHPKDFGFKVPLGFLLVGALIGAFRALSLSSIVVCGFASLVAGLLFSIFAADSARVQSEIAIRLNRLGFPRIAHWLYERAITIR